MVTAVTTTNIYMAPHRLKRTTTYLNSHNCWTGTELELSSLHYEWLGTSRLFLSLPGIRHCSTDHQNGKVEIQEPGPSSPLPSPRVCSTVSKLIPAWQLQGLLLMVSLPAAIYYIKGTDYCLLICWEKISPHGKFVKSVSLFKLPSDENMGHESCPFPHKTWNLHYYLWYQKLWWTKL